MLPEVAINYWAVLVAAIATMVVGSIWYAKPVFGTLWMKEIGRKEDELGNPGPAMILTFVASLVMAFVLVHFLAYTGATTVSTALTTAFWVWLGFVVPNALALSVFERRSWTLFGLNMGYQLVNLLVVAVILTLWV